MATLITADTVAGRLVCNARCYNATGPACDCICGGVNHGVGYENALARTRRIAAKIMQHPGLENISGLKNITFNAEQEPLFPTE